MTLPPRIEFLGRDFDPLTMAEAKAWLAGRRAADRFAYVVTPNVDQVVRLHGGEVPAGPWTLADLVLCDSRVLGHLARWCGLDLPVVPGSDLTAALLDEVAQAGDRILVIGGAENALGALGRRYPRLTFVHHRPPMGLRGDAAARRACVAAAAAADARFILLAIGTPQQEIVAEEMKRAGSVTGTALCIGASVDFLTGAQRRAPLLVRRLSLEWAWRLFGQPRRLWRRYLVEGPAIVPLVLAWRRAQPNRRQRP